MPILVKNHDYRREPFFIPGEPVEPGIGVDLVTTLPAWHRATREGTNAMIGSTSDPAVWTVHAVFGGDADEGAPGPPPVPGAFPTLAADRRDNVYCFYHTTGPTFGLRAWRSGDWGSTFEAMTLPGAAAGKKFPRATLTLESAFLACYDPGSLALLLYRSDDYFATLTLEDTIPAPEQLCDLGADRRGYVYLAYVASDESYRLKTSHDEFTAIHVLLDPFRSKASHDFTLPFGVHLVWSDETTLQAYQTEDTPLELREPPATVPGISYQQLGLCADRRDRLWMIEQASAGVFRVFWSDDGLEWMEVT